LHCNVSTPKNMADKFQGKYRIPSARLPHWDYANDGAYFITICTDNKIHHFGECKNGKMKLSTAGAIVQGFWFEIPKHFAHVILGEFTVMPNHIHGIVMIDWNLVGGRPDTVETLHCNVSIPDSDQTLQSDGEQTLKSDSDQTLQCNVSTDKNDFFKEISPKAGSISVIMGSYKSVCSKHIHQAFPEINFEWQERFWDNIIRSEESYKNIENYILNNPANWENDKFY
jgi:putative transposase